MKAKRGQALLETAAFLPMLLLIMTGIIYFSQYGILQVRAVQAVRYASLVTNGASANGYYTIESVYNELWNEGHATGGQITYPASFSCSGNGTAQADQAAISALYQNEALPTGTSALATAPPFFQADGTPAASCTASPIWLGNSGSANGYFVVQYTQLTGTKNLPPFLRQIGLPAQQSVQAGMGVVLPANPALDVYCNQTVAATLAETFPQLEPWGRTSTAAPYGAYPLPSPSATAHPDC